MGTAGGKGLLMSFGETEAAAQAGLESGYYAEQVAKFRMLLRRPPGRHHYEVVFLEGFEIASVSMSGGAG